MSTVWLRAHQPQVQAHTLRKWWDIISTLLPYPQSTRLIYTKAAFLSLADGRVAARAHVARKKALGSGPEMLWTAVICLENISPQSDVFRTWARDTLSLSVTKINSFQYSSKYLGLSLVMAVAVLTYWIFHGLKPASFWKRKFDRGIMTNKNILKCKAGFIFFHWQFLGNLVFPATAEKKILASWVILLRVMKKENFTDGKKQPPFPICLIHLLELMVPYYFSPKHLDPSPLHLFLLGHSLGITLSFKHTTGVQVPFKD